MSAPARGSRVAGKVALVTGAGRGLGRAYAVRLAAEGADVVAVDLCADVPAASMPLARSQDLERTVQEAERVGGRIIALHADVRDLDAMRSVVDRGVDTFGRLDIVSANAGIVGHGLSAEIAPEAWRELLDVNVTGTWVTCTAASPAMVAAGNGGSIVVTSSIAGFRGGSGVSHYVTSKHALIGLVRSLAVELGPHWIRVNAVCPTNTDTDMIMNDHTMRVFVPDAEHPTLEAFEAAAKQMHVLDVGWVEAADVANAVLFLASDEARYVTGSSLFVDAGAMAR